MKSENSFYNVAPSPLNKRLKVPTSKSFANRALVLAAVENRAIRLENMPESSDVINMIEALRLIGLDIVEDGDTITIVNSFPECEVPTTDIININTGDGGTTNRFLIPLLALGNNTYNLIPAEKMFERPMDELDEVLTSLGVSVCRNESTWFQLQGPYSISEYIIDVDCARSTQFATGLALSLSKLNVSVNPINLHSSRPYWEMTEELIKKIKENDTLVTPCDFSSLSYPLALSALGGRITVENCFGIDHYQADSEFIKILEAIGIELSFTSDGLQVVGKGDPKGFEWDCKNCPDLVPTLCFFASYLKSETKLKNIDVLRHKECDRLSEIQSIMSAFGVKFIYDSNADELTILGNSTKCGFIEYTPPFDHRMVMVVYLFMRFNDGGMLGNQSAVGKSFPDFFEQMG